MRKYWHLCTKLDVVLIIVIVFIAIFSYLRINRSNEGKIADIYANNMFVGSYSLNKNQVIPILSGCEAEIENGKIRMRKANCRDKLCVKQGFSDNLPIICLPNRIVIEIHQVKAKAQLHILH